MLQSAEGRRLQTLREYEVLDTLPEQALDDLTKLAAQICGVPIALISLVDEHRQWFKAKVGLEASETSRGVSFCAHAIEQQEQELFIVPDAALDARFAANSLVTGDPRIRFYAGSPLIARDGEGLGTLCVIDHVPRTLTAEQAEALRVLSRQVMLYLELRRKSRELLASKERLATSESRFRGIFDSTYNFIGLLATDGTILEANKTALDLIGVRIEDVAGKHFAETPWWAHSAEEREKLRAGIQRAAGGEFVRFETSHPGTEGEIHYVDFTLKPVFDEAGRVTHLVPEGRDITERKAAEAEFAWLATFPILNPNPVVELDIESDVVHYANPVATRLFPDLLAESRRHPFLSGLEEVKAQLQRGEVPTVRREVLLGEVYYAQIINYIPESNRCRVYGSDITLRKQTETALKASEERYHSLFENMLEGYCYCQVLRTDGRVSDFIYREVNSAFESVMGMRDVVSRKVSEVIPGIQAANPELFETYDRVTATGQSEEFETYLPGLGRWFSVAVYSPEQDHFVAVFDDITERKVAAANLAASEKLLQQFIKYTPAAMAMLDTEMCYMQTSDRWLRDYHLLGREVIGHSHYEIFPDIPQRWKDIHQRVLRGAVEQCDEDPFPRADGSLEWLQWEARPWRRGDGEIGGLVFYTQVITARKEAEAQMRESEERFRGAFDNAPIGMAMVSITGRWMRVNRALCEIVGLSAAELLACTFQDITHPEDLGKDLEQVRALISGTQEHYTMEKRYFHKTGRIVWVLLAVTVVRGVNGVPLHFVSQIEDITERHEAAARVQASLEEKEVLLREIHHRVKNNLQVITSLLQLGSGYLRDSQDAEIFKECQARIHAMGLVHDRLYRSGNLATIDFSEHLRELTSLIVRGQSNVSAGVQVVVESESIEVNLDIAIPLGLVTAELMTNAYKHAFTGRSCGKITVRLQRSEDRQLTLSVVDDGIGMPAGFEPEKARSLGLRLIRALSGQLRAQFLIASAPTGTNVQLTFPDDGVKPPTQ